MAPVAEQLDFDDLLELLVHRLSALPEVDLPAIYSRRGFRIQAGHPVLVGVIELCAVAADYFHRRCLTPDRDELGAAVAVVLSALFAPVSWRYRSHDNV